MSLKTYDPKAISLIVGGRVITGFEDGTFVLVSRESDSFADKAGAFGDVSRSYSNDKRGNITVTLMQTHPDNEYLSGLNTADELSGSGLVNVLVRDAKGNSIYESAEAWILKPADAEFAKEAGAREYVLRCAELLMLSGGN